MDNTPSIIQAYSEKYGNIKYVNIEHINPGMTGKQNAINEGLKYCSGEIILNTDADCAAGPLWVSKTVSYFAPHVDLTIGFSNIKDSDVNESLFGRLKALDMLFLMDAASGAVGIGFPVSCLGMNMAFRKSVVEEISYSSIGYTVTEDAAMIQKAAKNSRWKITAVYEKDASVSTYAEKKLKDFILQRLRWVTGRQVLGPWTKILLHSVFLFHLFILISLPFMFFHKGVAFAILLLLSVKMILDFIRCWHVCRKFDKIHLLKSFIPYEFFIILYSILIYLGSIFIRKVSWKGKAYAKKSPLHS
jgi:cellulose synthase/poly-beta-1,6-N-acetylglucosamine synthase-like glycosyltransferase